MTAANAPDELGTRAIRGGAVTIAAQTAKLGLYLLAGVVLARLLSPNDFGIFGIAFAIAGFLEIAKDGGLIIPVIQAKTLTHTQSSALFWINAGFGMILTLIACAAAPLGALIYKDPRLVPVMSALATTYTFGGLSAQHRALLRRNLRFTALAGCEVSALAAGTALALAAAFYGAGYWSLVCLYVAQEIVLAVAVLAVSGWWPQWGIRGSNIRPLLHFGGLIMGFDLAGYLIYKFDNLIVAYFFGPATLGFYDKAYQLLSLPFNQMSLPLSIVSVPILSRLQTEADRYRDYLGRSILLLTGFGMPVVAFLYGNADDFIALLFGRTWLPTAPIFRALALGAFLLPLTASGNWIYTSLGRARRQLPWVLGSALFTLAAFVCGIPWGVVGVAIAFSISRVVLLVPTLVYTCVGTPIKWTWILRLAVHPAIASLVALGVSTALASLLPPGWWVLFFNAATFSLAYLASWILMPGGKALLRENLMLAGAVLRNA